MRKLFALVPGIAAALVVLGCSTDPVVKVGDPNDPGFQAAKPELEAALASAIGGMDLAWDQAQSPSDTVNPVHPFRRGLHQATAAVDTFSYRYDTTGWHVAYASATQNGVTVTILDSVRLENVQGQPLQQWDSVVTDLVHAKIHVTLQADDTLPQSGTAALNYDYTFSGITSGTITAEGNHGFSLAGSSEDSTGTCNLDLSFAQQVLIVTFAKPAAELDGVCPTGGAVAAVESLSLACSNGQNSFAIDGDWSITAQFNGDGTVTVQAISNNTQWDFTSDLDCVNYENPLGGQ
jgi:hypothetical protein